MIATGNEVLLTRQQHSDLSSIAQSRALPAGYVFRAKLILMLAEGASSTRRKPSDGSTHWSCRKLATASGVSKDAVHRVCQEADRFTSSWTISPRTKLRRSVSSSNNTASPVSLHAYLLILAQPG